MGALYSDVIGRWEPWALYSDVTGRWEPWALYSDVTGRRELYKITQNHAILVKPLGQQSQQWHANSHYSSLLRSDCMSHGHLKSLHLPGQAVQEEVFGCNFFSKDTALWDIQMLQFTYFLFNSHSITALCSYYRVSLELLSSQVSATKFLSEFFIYATCPVNRSKYHDYLTKCCKLCSCFFFSHYNNNSYWTAWQQYGHTHPTLKMKTTVRSHSPNTQDEDSSTVTLTQHSRWRQQYGHTHPTLKMKTTVRSHSPNTQDEDSSTVTLIQHSRWRQQYGHTHPTLKIKTAVRSHSPNTHDKDSSTVTLTQHSR